MDRRADPRVEVRLRCHAAAAGINKSTVFVGLTENISRSGALLSWSGEAARGTLPHPGDLLTVDIELPAHRSFGQRCMHCEAVVIRVMAENGHPPRVGVQINQMSFRNDTARSRAKEQANCAVM
ncbi:MAG TPA: PilZ domain-containing protein [Bryobacteraceae bacterium]|nr:PilZ domain-containing protein [Bryobacteraceae bacterium]